MIKFTKMHGLGNDYICVDTRDDKNRIPEEKIEPFVRYVCNRHFGVGADGVISIDNSKLADFKMRIFNPDGTEAEMCGNGIRCFSKLVFEKKFTEKTQLSIETKAGIKYTYLRVVNGSVEEIQVDMGEPCFDKDKIPVLTDCSSKIPQVNIKIDGIDVTLTCVSMGNPHAVAIVNNVENIDIQKYGPLIEKNQNFPNKTNVEFIQIIDKGHIKMRVWERGVGETLACGTGACAVAVVSHIKGYTRRNVKVYLPAGELKIDWSETANRVYMTGIATKVFDGEIL